MHSKHEANVHTENACVFQRLRVCTEPAAVLLQEPWTRARYVHALGATCKMLECARGAHVLRAKLREHARGAQVLRAKSREHARGAQALGAKSREHARGAQATADFKKRCRE